eukprot:2863288-Rhodomonas_salina.1
MSGTDPAYQAIGGCGRGTKSLSGGPRSTCGTGLRTCYAMSGTDVAYGGYRTTGLLCDVRY